jgi:transcription initiation factor TFIIB
MQEIEQLKVLQSERESFRSRTKQREQEKKAENQTETICPECGGRQLTHDRERAELVCQSCGLVIDDEFIDRGPEWRAFDADQRMKRARTGAPMTLTIHDKGLSTMIDWRNKDSYGRSISSKNRAQLYRLRKWQRRIRVSNATERNLAFALSELDRMASAVGLPRNIRESSAMVYRDAVDKNLIRGRSIEGVAAAALYAACRQCSVPRTLDEIAEVSRVSRKEIGRTYRFISRELGLRLPPTSPLDYVPRFCSGLTLKGEVQSRCIEILRLASERELTSGRGPTGVAAAAIYIASILGGERRTQREVAEVAGVTEVTIRNRYKELAEKLDIEIIL